MTTEPVTRTHIPTLKPMGDATPHVARILEVMAHIRLFEDFDVKELARLAAYMVCYRAPPGTEIIREGDAGDFMLLLLDGGVEIVKRDSGGLPVRIGEAGPGKTLGEMSLVDGEPRFASCVTTEESLFAVLDRESLTRLLAEEAQLGIKILIELVMLLNQRLRNVSARLMRALEDIRLRRF